MLNDIQVYTYFHLTPVSRASDDNRFSYVANVHVGFVDNTGIILCLKISTKTYCCDIASPEDHFSKC